MDSYKRGFDQQHTMEIMRQIEDYHDQFLAATEADAKAESLRLMRGYAAQYLYLVPHNKKFALKETYSVLANSVHGIVNLDPRDASAALENLAKYSHNLLEQPWRKEFHRVKLISGFFIHNIRAYLVNAQELLLSLNYTAIDDTTLQLTSMPDIKRLKLFSKDCFMASQECLILSKLWERFSAKMPDYPFSARDAYESRKELVGDVDTVLSRLLYHAQQKQHEEAQKYLELERRQKEAQRIEDIRRQQELALQERQRREEDDLRRKQLEEERMEVEEVRPRINTNHDQLLPERESFDTVRRNPTSNRLVDIDDNKTPKESEVVEKVHHYTQRLGGYTDAEYQSKYVGEKYLDNASPRSELQQMSARNSNGAFANLPDHHQHFYSHQSTASGLKTPLSQQIIEDSVRDYEEKSHRVEQRQSRHTIFGNGLGLISGSKSTEKRSAFSPYSRMESKLQHHDFSPYSRVESKLQHNDSTELLSSNYKLRNSSDETDHGRGQRDHPSPSSGSSSLSTSILSSSSSSASFNSPKFQQDYPTSTLTANRRSPTNEMNKIEQRSTKVEEDKLQPKALLKTKVPAESAIPTDEKYEASSLCASSPLEVGTDLRTVTQPGSFGNYNYLKNEEETTKTFVDKDLPLSENSFVPWTCPHCTFNNRDPKFPKICELCSKSKDFHCEEETVFPANQPVLKLTKLDSSNDSVQRVSPSPAPKLSIDNFRKGLLSETEDLKWKCCACTYENKGSNPRCEMCRYERKNI